MFGPTYKPRRWFRRKARWVCTWCKYRWPEDVSKRDRMTWLDGYEFALRNLNDESVQADLARVSVR
jgi:hypothetical protein